jgi:chaperonin GroES
VLIDAETTLPRRTPGCAPAGGPRCGDGAQDNTNQHRLDDLAVVPGGNTLASASKTASKLQPLGDRVVVKPTPREEMTKSGIVLPDTAKEKPQEGLILAVGPGRVLDDGKREAMDVKVGQKVLYGKYAGTEFKVEEEDLLIVSQKDILAIVAA